MARFLVDFEDPFDKNANGRTAFKLYARTNLTTRSPQACKMYYKRNTDWFEARIYEITSSRTTGNVSLAGGNYEEYDDDSLFDSSSEEETAQQRASSPNLNLKLFSYSDTEKADFLRCLQSSATVEEASEKFSKMSSRSIASGHEHFKKRRLTTFLGLPHPRSSGSWELEEEQVLIQLLAKPDRTLEVVFKEFQLKNSSRSLQAIKSYYEANQRRFAKQAREFRQSTITSTSSFANPSPTIAVSDRKRSHEEDSSTSSSPSKAPRIERSFSSPTPPVASSSTLTNQPVRSFPPGSGSPTQSIDTPVSTRADYADLPPPRTSPITIADNRPPSPSSSSFASGPPPQLEPSSFLQLGVAPSSLLSPATFCWFCGDAESSSFPVLELAVPTVTPCDGINARRMAGKEACEGCVDWAERERKRLREERKVGDEVREVAELCFVTLGLVDRGKEERRRKVEG